MLNITNFFGPAFHHGKLPSRWLHKTNYPILVVAIRSKQPWGIFEHILINTIGFIWAFVNKKVLRFLDGEISKHLPAFD